MKNDTDKMDVKKTYQTFLKRSQFSGVDVSGLRKFLDMFSLRDKMSGQLQSRVRV